MTDDITTIDLFPLRLVLLPGEALPLHIFEERYRRLIARCRESGSAFGAIMHDDDSVAEAGCTAVVHEVASTSSYAGVSASGSRPCCSLTTPRPTA